MKVRDRQIDRQIDRQTDKHELINSVRQKERKTKRVQGYTHKHTYNQLQVRPYHINNR